MPATMGSYLASGAIYFGLEKKTFHIFKRIKRKGKKRKPVQKRGKKTVAIPPPFFAQRCNWHLEQYRFPCCNGTVLFLPTLLLSDSPGGTKKCARKGERPKRYLGRQIDPLHARGAIAACIGGGDSDDAKPQKFHRRRRPNDIAAGIIFFAKINAVVLATTSAKQQHRLHLSRHGSLIKGPCKKKVWELNYSPSLQK